MNDGARPVLSQRLQRLRALLAARGAAGMLVRQADEHGSEYLPAYAQRLRWLTGFTGSAATVVVLHDAAALFTDGRYAIQARQQIDTGAFEVQQTPASDPARWLDRHAPRDAVLLYDPWLISLGALRSLRGRLRADIRLQAAPSAIDALWADAPPPSLAPLRVHPDALAGATSAAKRAAIAADLARQGLDAVVVSALDSVAWLFNVRGSDIAHNPVARAHALLRSDGSATLFVDARKLTAAVREHLGPAVEIADHGALAATLRGLRGASVGADPDACAAAVFDALADADVVEARDPCVLPRATKTDAEIAGARAAHLRDGVALCRFLHWLEQGAVTNPVDEWQAAERLRALREEASAYRDASFATISAAGPNAAMQHYAPTAQRARRLQAGTLYLVDSGAQYDDGTTDVTRTVAIGEPDELMRRRFTQALRGHIAIACTRFPLGTSGGDLDALARQFLWQDGVDYASGTGHGVGSQLCVHEGPAFIGRRGGTRPVDEPIRARMVLSIEPGFYLEGQFGIRTENLYLVVACAGDAGAGDWLAFEPLTLAPIDRRLIDVAALSGGERRWIDTYHRMVEERLRPHLDADVGRWLADACRPL